MALLGYFRQKGQPGTMMVVLVGFADPESEGPVAMSARIPDAEPLLTPSEVAAMFRVDPKTVTRWAKAGKLTSIRTLGGHRRYREVEVRALLSGDPMPATPTADADQLDEAGL